MIVGPVKFNKLSKEMIENFTLNNKIKVFNYFLKENKIVKNEWDEGYIKKYIEAYNPNLIKKYGQTYYYYNKYKLREPYGDNRIGGASYLLCELLEKEKLNLLNKKIAIIGSQTPWIESILINYGANNITTVEYNVPICNHKIIKCISYNDFCKSEIKYDIVLSYSSIEHSGLGRYGDKIDPDGDIKTMNSIFNHLSDTGIFCLGIPVSGKDALSWNAHRQYGPIRFNKLLLKFKKKNIFGYNLEIIKTLGAGRDWKTNVQPWFVLKKIL